MIRRQLHLQKVGRSLDPPTMRGEERGWYATWNHTALILELSEALNEIAWKTWSVDKDKFNRDQYVQELVDAWHFLMNLLLLAGDAISDESNAESLADEFYRRYIDKSAVNMERFRSGKYNSRATKCPDCGREVTETEALERYRDVGDLVERAYLCLCGRTNWMTRAPATS